MDKKDQLFDRAHDLRVFIHEGIDKFLDKQAVRDLIIAYDSDDIFIKGEQQFFQSADAELARSRENAADEDVDAEDDRRDPSQEAQASNFLSVNNGKPANMAGKKSQ